MLPGGPPPAGASTYCPGGRAGPCRPPPSPPPWFPRRRPGPQAHCPLPSSPRPPRGLRSRCRPVSAPLPRGAQPARPASQGLPRAHPAAHPPEGTPPPPLLGNSYPGCKSPCCHRLGTRPPLRWGHFLRRAECAGANRPPSPLRVEVWERR